MNRVVGWADFGSPWHDTYECADGKYVTVCALEPQFYQELVERLELTDNPIFANQWDTAQWPRGRQELKNLFLGKTQQQWCDLLEGTDVCFGPVLNFSEAPQHPHNVARGTFLDIDGVVQPAPAPKFSAAANPQSVCRRESVNTVTKSCRRWGWIPLLLRNCVRQAQYNSGRPCAQCPRPH